MSGLEILAMGASALGTFVQARGTLAAGAQANAQARAEAEQLEYQGKQEQAEAQQEAFEQERKRDLALSQLQARAAASGFTATDPTALALSDEIAKYGTLQALTAQARGQAARAGLDAQASSRRLEGRTAMKAARTGAISTIIGGVAGGLSSFAKSRMPAGTTNNYYYG